MNSRLITFLLYFTAILWAAFALFWFFRDSDYRFFYAFYGMVYAVVLSLSAYFINKNKGKIWAWRTATILVGISIIASIFDQIGWIDIAYMIFASVLFIMLIKERAMMFRKRKLI